MSHTTLHVFGLNGQIAHNEEYRNGHTAMVLWEMLWRKYLAKRRPPTGQFEFGLNACFNPEGIESFPMMNPERLGEFWDLDLDPRLSKSELIVFKTTYDRVVIRRADFVAVADAFDEFTKEHVAVGATHVWHLPAWAEKLRELSENEEVLAVGWTQTFVSEDSFLTQYPEDGDPVPYDLNVNKEHWFLELP